MCAMCAPKARFDASEKPMTRAIGAAIFRVPRASAKVANATAGPFVAASAHAR